MNQIMTLLPISEKVENKKISQVINQNFNEIWDSKNFYGDNSIKKFRQIKKNTNEREKLTFYVEPI